MGGSRPSAPTHYRPTPTAPIIYQKIQSKEGWEAADSFLKRLRGERDKIASKQAKVLDTSYQTALANEAAKRKTAGTTPDNPMWQTEQAARSKVSAADAAGDKVYMQNLTVSDQKKQTEQKKQSSEDARRRAAQLASLAGQQGSGYEPPKPSGSK
jgi:hypothetical protein